MAPTPSQAQANKVASANKSSSKNKKQPNARVQRYLKSTASQLREPVKAVLLLKGIHCSQEMGAVLQELRSMTAPHSKLLNKKNQIAPFSDGPESLEFLTTKNDCALFALASTNKKRPNNLTMGRTFHHQMLDMCELTILRFKSAIRGSDYDGQVPKKRVGSKPLLLFCGPEWQQQHGSTGTGASSYFANLQNLLTDFYRGTVVDKLILSGLDHIIVFTLAQAPRADGNNNNNNNNNESSSSMYVLYQRTYYCKLKKEPNPNNSGAAGGDGQNIPLAYLEPCGPDFDFLVQQPSTLSSSSSKQLKVGRSQWADSDLYKASRRQPAAILKQQKHAANSASKKKNLSTNLFGETVGRLHLSRQNVVHATGRKSKALRRAEKLSSQLEKEAIEGELQREGTDMDQEFQQTFGFSEKEQQEEKSSGSKGKRGGGGRGKDDGGASK
jgi:ribosome production factor 2